MFVEQHICYKKWMSLGINFDNSYLAWDTLMQIMIFWIWKLIITWNKSKQKLFLNDLFKYQLRSTDSKEAF